MSRKFNFQKYLERTLRYHHRSGHGPQKQVLIREDHVVKQEIKQQRLDLIRKIKERYPNKHPLEKAELFHRYFWRYGTYKLPIPTKNGSTMTSNEFKKKVKDWIKEFEIDKDDLVEYTPWARSTFDYYLTPSSGTLSEHVKSTIKTAMQRVAVDKSNKEAPDMTTQTSKPDSSLKDRVKAEREAEEAEKDRIAVESDDREEVREEIKKEPEPSTADGDTSSSPEDDSDKPRITVKESKFFQIEEITYSLNQESPEQLGRALQLVIEKTKDVSHTVKVLIGDSVITIKEG